MKQRHNHSNKLYIVSVKSGLVFDIYAPNARTARKIAYQQTLKQFGYHHSDFLVTVFISNWEPSNSNSNDE